MKRTHGSVAGLAAAPLAALVLLGGALDRAAGADPAEVRETVDVRIVTVDVWVTDRDGNPVRDLDAGDFQVLEDGRPVPISHFVELEQGVPQREPAAGAGPADAPPAVARHLIVYLDRSRTRPSSYRSVLADLAELLESPDIEAENVLMLQQEQGLSIVSPFGSTRRELLDALGRLTRESAGAADLDNDAQLALDAIRSAWQQSRDLTGAGTDSLPGLPGARAGAGGFGSGTTSPREAANNQGSDLGMGPDACRTFHSQIQPILDSWSRNRSQRVELTLAHLSEIATSLAGLPGVKTLLYFSDGLETQPGMALAVYANSLCPGGGGDLLTGARRNDVTAALLDLTRHAASNRVIIHSIRASRPGDAAAGRETGSVGRTRAGSSFESARRTGEREGLRLIAHETGGIELADRGELLPELRRILAEAGNHYALAYQPPAAAGESGPEHGIEIRLADASLSARYRHGYVEKDTDTWLTERVLGALNLGISDNPLEARLGAGEVSAAADGGYRFPLHVFVPVEQLTFAGSEAPGWANIQVTVLARHLDTGAVARRDQSFRLRGEPGAAGFANLPIELELAAGVYLTAVGVRDRASGETSFVSTTVQVGSGG